MLAIAANGFNKPSETFIRAHVRLIAPGNTLLVAERRELKRPVPAPLILFSKRFPVFVREGGGAGSVVANALSPRRWGQSRDAYLADLLRRAGVDVLMAEYGTTAVHLMEPARLAGCRLFVHFHGVDASRGLLDADLVARYRRLFDLAEGIFAPSTFIADKLAGTGCPRAKLHVVPCGVDVDTFTPAEGEPHRFLAVGRFTEKKAPLVTIRAFAQVRKSCPTAVLDMIGDGPLLADARADVARLGLGDSVILHGAVDVGSVRAAMARCGVFVQHSVTAANGDIEGLPVAILEAMSAGLPVISTLHSGIPEAVIDGQTGYLVAEHDLDAMAARMAALAADPALARQLGMAGRERAVARFSLEVTIGRLQRLMGLAP